MHKRKIRRLGTAQLKHIGVLKRTKPTNTQMLCKPCGIEFSDWKSSISHELICPFILHTTTDATSQHTGYESATGSSDSSASVDVKHSDKCRKRKRKRTEPTKASLSGSNAILASDSSESDEDFSHFEHLMKLRSPSTPTDSTKGTLHYSTTAK
mmetsp:Transcript_8343/g.9564  ORF Transcript_8343/g.9564 Transcript_8343/m.9564 type:complete len:154 (-) Transcript_8343:1927-2388(-)